MKARHLHQQGGAAFRRLVAGGPGDAGNVWLVLPEGDVLVRGLSLPLAAEEALRDTVGFELDRYTPFTPSQAYFDFPVTGRDAAAQRLSLELAVASREVVDRRVAELKEVGATVVGICPGEKHAGMASPLNLLSQEQRGRPAVSQATHVARALAALALLLLLAVLVLPLWQKRSAVIALMPRMHAAKAQADVAERMGKGLELFLPEARGSGKRGARGGGCEAGTGNREGRREQTGSQRLRDRRRPDHPRARLPGRLFSEEAFPGRLTRFHRGNGMASIEGTILDFRRLDQLASGHTALHRLDARAKVLTTLAFVLAVVSFGRYALAALLPFFLYPVAVLSWGISRPAISRGRSR